jgi:hypothetical protein
MKVALAILLVVLLLLLALPVAIGMDMHGGSCPACSSTEHSLGLGICFAVLAFTVFILFSSGFRTFLRRPDCHKAPPAPSLFRPPRTI